MRNQPEDVLNKKFLNFVSEIRGKKKFTKLVDLFYSDSLLNVFDIYIPASTSCSITRSSGEEHKILKVIVLSLLRSVSNRSYIAFLFRSPLPYYIRTRFIYQGELILIWCFMGQISP